MPLSNDIISEFVEVTASHVDVKKDTTLYGTIVNFQNKTFVRLDGSDLLTPIASTTEVADGQRVMVMLKNHAATVTGNISDISASSSTVASVREDVVSARKVIADEVEAIEGRFNSLSTEYASIGNLNAANAKIDTLIAEDVKINGKLTAQDADIEKLNTNKLDATTANITFATIKNLEAANADINNLQANKADINHLHADYATIDHLEATYAKVGDLEAATAQITDLNATFGSFENATADNFEAVNAEIENLDAKIITTDTLDAKYANVDFANIGEAAIEKLYTKWGIIEDGTFKDGEFTGKLVAVELNADMIKTGSLVADRLVVKGEDGLYYKLNVDGSGTIPEEVTEEELQNGLHGSNIIASSITADKISVSELTAFAATIAGINIGQDEASSTMYSGVKSSPDNSTDGFYLDKDGQFAVGNGTEYIKFHKTSDGKWTFAIAADNISLTSGKTLSDAFTRLDNAEASLEVHAEGIAAKVSSDYFEETMDGYYTKLSIDKKLETTATGITSHVSSNYASLDEFDKLGARVSTNENNIEQTSKELSVKISRDEYYGVRRFDAGLATTNCFNKQGIRVVGEFIPRQNGTGDPTPDNIRSISGRTKAYVVRCKKNLIDMSSMTPGSSYATVEYSDNSIRVYTDTDGTYRDARSNTIMLRAGVTYTLSGKVISITSGIARISLRETSGNIAYSLRHDTDGAILPVGEYSLTFTPSSDMLVFLSLMTTWNTESSGDITFGDIQLELGDAATAYEPFDGNIYEIDPEQTVYGGTIDVANGLLNVTMVSHTLNGTESTIAKLVDDTYQTQSSIFVYRGSTDSIGGYGTSICSHFTNTKTAHVHGSSMDGLVNVYSDGSKTAGNYYAKFFRWGGPNTTVEEFKAWLAEQYAAGTPVQICYTLATPIEVQIVSHDIPAADGENTVYTDLGYGYIEFGHESLDGLGGASQVDMTTQLSMKAGSYELSVIDNRVGGAETNIQALTDMISTLVRGSNGESLMVQQDDGWIFNIGAIESKLNDASDDIGELQGSYDDVNSWLTGLEAVVKDLGDRTEYVQVTTYGGKPAIVLGETDSPFTVMITNTDIQFKEGTSTPASISNQALNIDTAVVKNELRQGGFAWVARSNGNYGLLWKGE